MTLLAALLLERRVILVAKERDTVSAAVHAAAALLYPFRWQHIYLPLLPIALKVRHCRKCSMHNLDWLCRTLLSPSPALHAASHGWLGSCTHSSVSCLLVISGWTHVPVPHCAWEQGTVSSIEPFEGQKLNARHSKKLIGMQLHNSVSTELLGTTQGHTAKPNMT